MKMLLRELHPAISGSALSLLSCHIGGVFGALACQEFGEGEGSLNSLH